LPHFGLMFGDQHMYELYATFNFHQFHFLSNLTAWPSCQAQFSVANIHEGFGNTDTHLLHRR